jgi:calcineurin-like phosphoesterase family protein
MKIYLISDTHFNHDRMVDMCDRPENFNELLWRGFDSLPDDCMLIHLGDICIGGDADVHKRLKEYKFKKVLVRGNHDSKSDNWYLNNGWDFVCREFSTKIFGKHIIFSHVPFKYNKERYSINVHGHMHNTSHHPEVKIFNDRLYQVVAVEYINYRPIKLEKLLNN